MSKSNSPLVGAMQQAKLGSVFDAAPADTLTVTVPANVSVVHMTTPGSGEASFIRLAAPQECPGHIVALEVVQDGTGTLAVYYTIGEATTTDPLSDLFTVLGESAVLMSTGQKWVVLYEDIA